MGSADHYELKSKIKNVIIELHNYSFFHGPTDLEDADDRFVGRLHLINHLRTLLTRSSTKSGVYLVAGYRGMGKSSYVNKAIDGITCCNKSIIKLERFIRIFLMLSFMFFIENCFQDYFWNHQNNLSNFNLFYLFLNLLPFFLCVFLGYLLYNEYSSIFFSNPFKIISRSLPHYNFFRIAHDFFLILGIYLLSSVAGYLFKFWTQSEWALLILCLLYIRNLAVECNRITYNDKAHQKNAPDSEAPNKFLSYCNNIKHTISDITKIYFSTLYRKAVNINLGIEDLKDIDVLRLISRNLESNYKEFLEFSRRTWTWKTLKYLILFLFTLASINFNFFNNFHNNFNEKFLIWYLIPSQTLSYNYNYVEIDNINYYKTANITESFSKEPDQYLAKKRFFIKLINYSDNYFEADLGAISPNLLNRYRNIKGTKYFAICKTIAPITRFIDFHIFTAWSETIRFIPFINHIKALYSINYLLIFYFILYNLIITFFFNRKFLNVVTHRNIIERLSKINERIEAQLTTENASELNASTSRSLLKLSAKKIKLYPRAHVRDIDEELIDIFHDIDSIPRHTIRPEFIFVLDELDKVEAKEDYVFDNTNNLDSIYLLNKTRLRQHKIIHILSSLKNFLHTSKAKFIFIGGRELYDAVYADVSDRDSKLSNIFHDTIYVDSFLKDSSDNSGTDITSLTEKYVCQFLFPKDNKNLQPTEKEELNLASYKVYLKEKVFNNVKKEEQSLMINKVIGELSNFISYLTYRSNGAPKKITSYFEKYIFQFNDKFCEGDYLRVINEDNKKNKKKKNSNLFLVFRYKDQYTFGIVSYIANPFIFTINRSIRDYGDKLLVSIAFILDHIYKYHRVGFSLEDLESSPEIIDVNKPPQVKELFNIILKFLSYTQIEVINSGLYNFKFNKRISDEITYLCKIKESESAAFNFTLDESLTIKKHYSTLLKDLSAKYHNYLSTASPDFIRSLSYIHIILGDLHFYDEEYDSAIIEYLEAVQLYGDDKFEKLSIELIIMLFKAQLKLGLAYEKRKSYDMALVTYGKLTARIIKFRNIFKKDLYITDDASTNSLDRKTVSKCLALSTENWDVKKDRVAFKISLIEKMRLFYLPFLTKFQILEKASNTGITKYDLELLKTELDYLIIDPRDTSKKDLITVIIYTEIHDRIGDILFFKNAAFTSHKTFNPAEIICFKRERDNLCFKNNDINNIFANGLFAPCTSCNEYLTALDGLYAILDVKTDSSHTDKLKQILIYISRKNSYLKDETLLRTVANLLSDIGNTFLSCCKKDGTLTEEFINNLLKVLTQGGQDYADEADKIFGRNTPDALPKTKLDEAVIYFYLSASFYRRAMDYKEYGFQLTKILRVLHDYYKPIDQIVRESETYKMSNGAYIYLAEDFITDIAHGLVKRAIRAYYRAYENTSQIELNKLLQIIDSPEANPAVYDYVSINWEIKEILILYYSLKLYTCNINLDTLSKSMESIPYQPIYSMYNRTLQLEYYEAIYRKIYTNKNDEFRLIPDAIFCLMQLIKAGIVSGKSYDVNNSFLGNAYYLLAFWALKYNSAGEQKKEIKDIIKETLGTNNSRYLDPTYNFEMALRYYRLAIDAHRNGQSYKDLIENMNYLNDDFNDNFYHFCAAMERFNCNTELFYKRIDSIRNLIKEERGEYKPENYSI